MPLYPDPRRWSPAWSDDPMNIYYDGPIPRSRDPPKK